MDTATSSNVPNNVSGGTFLNYKYFNPEYLFNKIFAYVQDFFSYITSQGFMHFWKTTLFFFSLFFLTVICYTIVRMFEIRAKEKKHLHHELEEYAHHKALQEKKQKETAGGSNNGRWVKTLSYLFSEHGSDWKLAIIEADSMLEELMEQLGFHGETLGDRLKLANQNNFPQLTTAWEVHTIRNRIAHEGASFEISQHEAKRVIAIYEKIFRMYGFI